MKTFLKLTAFASVTVAAAAADRAFEVYDADAATQAAIAQFHDTDDSARIMRARNQARPLVEQLIWLTVPAAAAVLFSGDLARLLADRK